MKKIVVLIMLVFICSCHNNEKNDIRKDVTVEKPKQQGIKNETSIEIKKIDTVNENILSGTRWECKIADGCINLYEFDSDSSFIFYSCEMEDEYFGNYYFKRDTLFINEKGSVYDTELPEESTERAERKLYELIVKDNTLKHLSVSNWENGKWIKSDFKFDDSYLYKKVNK